jgi:outer membrane protein assembly factor BamB
LDGELAPSPIVVNGLVFVIEPYSKLVAIRADGKGDVTKTHIAWVSEEGGPDICSPVSDGERIYMLGSEGLLSCYKTSDGKRVWEHDLEESCKASPSLVGKNIYVLSEEKGVMFVIEAGDEYKELGKCELGEKCYASPAFADGRIYIRGVEHLYCIAKKDSTAVPIQDQSKNWPSFRGPEGNGVSAYTNVPTRWDGKTGEGILWKTKVPLPGHNSPIVWGNRMFLSGGDPNNLAVFCFDTTTGKLLWKGDVTQAPLKEGEEPLEPMEDTGWAAPTAVTDGKRVYAMFVTGDIGAFDFNGKKVWQKSLGTPENHYGHATSLAIYRNLVLIQYDQGVADDGLSKMIALDGFTGKVAWQTKRPVDSSWSSPIVVRVGDRFQVLTCSVPYVIAYEPAKGTELWRADCMDGELAPSPIYADGLVFVIEPYNKLVAIKPDGKGDVTKTHIAWSVEEGGPDICSPVSDGERIYMLGTEGFVSCYKTSDGKSVWEHDLEEFCLASPSLVGKNIYVLSQEEGAMFIFEAADEYKEVGKNVLGEECHASPAFADGRIYIRGVEHLYCIGNQD